NPAAVFTEAAGLDDETMQAFARQLNLVESVFVWPGNDSADFRLRYFTPHGEIPVAGHPSIAAWLAMIHTGKVVAMTRSRFRQVNLAGVQEIEIDGSNIQNPVVTMKQPPARFLEGRCENGDVASVFDLSIDDIDGEFPVRAVDTGLGHLIVPLRSLAALMKVKRNIEPLRHLCQSMGVREAQLFCFETFDPSAAIHTRNLCPREGLEDPACGVGNGALSAYLARYAWSSKAQFSLTIEQGNVVSMPSLINTSTIVKDGAAEVFVGGGGTVMLEGNFLV
ncbi:MAG TPA: PhzF family phenazine biosynthesis protein, partial [Chroococcales cyanobacterium]